MYKRIRVIWDRNVIDVKFDTMQAPDEAPGAIHERWHFDITCKLG